MTLKTFTTEKLKGLNPWFVSWVVAHDLTVPVPHSPWYAPWNEAMRMKFIHSLGLETGKCKVGNSESCEPFWWTNYHMTTRTDEYTEWLANEVQKPDCYKDFSFKR
jgi:hypothetical protein